MSDDLPEGWAAVALGELVRPAKDKAEPGTASGRPYLGMEHVEGETGRVLGHADAKDVRSTAVTYRAGDVLYGKLRPYLNKVLVAPFDGVGSTEFIVFAQQPHIDSRYLRWLLARREFVETANDRAAGVQLPRVTFDKLADLEQPIPPLAEQRRIVAKVEALLEQVRRAKDRLDRVPLILKRFRQAVLAAACSGALTEQWRERHGGSEAPERPRAERVERSRRRGANISREGELLLDDMPELPEQWRYWRADEVVDPETVVTYGIVLPGPEHPGGVPYVRQQDIVDGRILVPELRRTTVAIAAKHARSSLRAGDVLLCIIRNLRVAIVPAELDGANLTQGTVRMRPGPHVRGDYLAAYLEGPAAQAWMKARYFGMDMPRINVEDARAIPVALPPLDEQVAIMRRVDALLALASAIDKRVERSARRAANLPQAILSKAFAGDLVPTEAALARAESRDYETVQELLRRTMSAAQGNSRDQREKKARTARAPESQPSNARVRKGPHLILPPMPALAPTLGADEEVAMSALALLHAAGGSMTRADMARAFVLRSNPDLLRDLAPSSLTQATEWATRVNSRTIPPGKLAAVLRLLEERSALAFSVNAASQSVVTVGPDTPPRDEVPPWFIYEATLALLVLQSLTSPRLKSIHNRLVGEDRTLLELAS